MQISSSTSYANSYPSTQTAKSNGGGTFASFIEGRVNLMYQDSHLDLEVTGSKGAGSFGALIESQLSSQTPAAKIASEMKSRFTDLVASSKNGDGQIFTASVAKTLLAPTNSQVTNPIDKLTDSDVKLFHDTTGLYLYNGEIVDENGNLSNDEGAGDLVNALYDLREHGVADSDGYMHKISGAITADDLAKLIEPYRRAGSENYSSSTLDKAIEVLTSQQHVADHEIDA